MSFLTFVLPSLATLNRHVFEALRLSVLPVAALMAVWQIVLRAIPLAEDSFVRILGVLLVGAFVYCLSYAWFATRWHRFLLRAEPQESLLPALDQGVVAYGARLFLLVTGLTVFGLAVGLVLGAVTRVGPVSDIKNLFVFALVYWLFFRFCPVLTTTALGGAITRREAWVATRGTSKACLGLSVMFVALTEAVFWIRGPGDADYLALEAAFVWVTFWGLIVLHATAVSVVHGHTAAPG